MPEGDAVWRTARRLHRALAGEVVTDWELRWPSAPTTSARGRTTLEVVPRGKHILHRLEGGVTLHTHLRMEGRWRVRPPHEVTTADLANPDLRALVGCGTATALGTRLGMLDVVATRQEDTLVGHLGPDLLDPAWDAAHEQTAVANLVRDPGRAVGEALLDQRVLAGVGTMWLAETLWLERVSPWTAVGEIDDPARVVRRAHDLLVGTLAYAGSVSTGVDRDGERLWCFERTTLPCRRCGTPIRTARVGTPPADRAGYYCPRCQGGLAPGDDGRRQRPVSVRGLDARARRERRTSRPS